MAHIFISYKRSDKKRVNKLIKLLHQIYGKDAVWWDQDFVGGDLWWHDILEQIAECHIFIYLMTPDSLISPYCQAELEEARRLRKHILPVKFKRWTDVPSVLAQVHYVDLDGRVNHKTITPLLRSINKYDKSALNLPPLMDSPVSAPIVPPRERRNLIAQYAREIIIAVIAGIILAIILQSDRFALPPSTPTPTLDPPIQLAIDGVTSNQQWTPYMQELNDVEMMLVPSGSFMMGNDDGTNDEQPAHEQPFDSPFWIDRYEVSNEQYGSTGCEGYSSEPNQPRNCVDWFDATAFCEARNAYLPSEAEWEYAARGPNGLVYPWGNEFIADNVVYSSNSDGQTAVVDTRPNGISWVGAYNMSGNVWEWTNSLYEDYPYNANDGREEDTGDRTDVQRVLRGASFLLPPYNGQLAFC